MDALLELNYDDVVVHTENKKDTQKLLVSLELLKPEQLNKVASNLSSGLHKLAFGRYSNQVVSLLIKQPNCPQRSRMIKKIKNSFF